MSYAKNLDPDLAKKYDFWVSLAWWSIGGVVLGGLVSGVTLGEWREALIITGNLSIFVLVVCVNMMAANIRKMTARRYARTQEIYDRIAERRYINETDPDRWKN